MQSAVLASLSYWLVHICMWLYLLQCGCTCGCTGGCTCCSVAVLAAVWLYLLLCGFTCCSVAVLAAVWLYLLQCGCTCCSVAVLAAVWLYLLQAEAWELHAMSLQSYNKLLFRLWNEHGTNYANYYIIISHNNPYKFRSCPSWCWVEYL